MATIKDIAKEAKVSEATVSIVLQNKSKERKISLEVQERVKQAAAKLQYVPNLAARRLREGKKHKPVIGIYLSNNHILSRVLTGLQNETKHLAVQYDFVVCNYKKGNLSLEQGLYSGNMFNAAIIFHASETDLLKFEQSPPVIPIVLCNQYSDKFSTISVDNSAAGDLAVALFKKNGHQTAAVVIPSNPNVPKPARLTTFINSCCKHGIWIQPEHIFYGEKSIAGGINCAINFLESPNPPKAIFCTSDLMAFGVCHYFRDMNIAIPEEFEVIATEIEKNQLLEYSSPPVTAINIPIESIASQALHLLEEQVIKGIYDIKHIKINTPSLTIRKSTK